MSRTRHTEAEILAVLKQSEAGRKAEEVAREAGCRNTRSTPGKRSTGGWK